MALIAPKAMDEDEPTWQQIHGMIGRGGLSEAGAAAARWAVDQFRARLGESWSGRQYDKGGWFPLELLAVGAYRYALPQVLSWALWLNAAAAEPTFAKVRTSMKKGMDTSTWRHTWLQLEVARAASSMGASFSFEPPIPGSIKSGDLLIDPEGGSPWMVETVTVPRADVDMKWEDYEDRFQAAIRRVEHKHNVTCVVVLDDHSTDAETQAWLSAIDAIASIAAESRQVQVIQWDIGVVTVYPDPPPPGPRFIGAAQYRDGWRRLGRTLAKKAEQITEPFPVTVRCWL
ncbi:hypothetical protein [Rhizomonospora bruguierae]|uniref:hypothetical protein n=1 Tax=Rhizomonospora bruguierae TaxID=1581705 RepID=UPI001BCFAEEB|nr:hypothetical protein [Micromonospora sp. NBRC 107566]